MSDGQSGWRVRHFRAKQTVPKRESVRQYFRNLHSVLLSEAIYVENVFQVIYILNDMTKLYPQK